MERTDRSRLMSLCAVSTLLASACGGHPGSANATPSSSGASPLPADTTPAALPRIRTQLVATVREPLAMAVRAGDDALYIVSKRGQILTLRNGEVGREPVLDLSSTVSRGSEQGLLGAAFSPDGDYLYVNYTDRKGDTHVMEYTWRDGRPDLSTRRPILFVDQPFPNHNGGNLVFGPDGYLYVGLGDGGSDENTPSPGDPFKNGQNLGVLLAKMLRIQPRMPDGSLPLGGRRYAIPPSNPFVERKGARPEIWAYGLRHPWRYSFDSQTGDLWIGDVGAGAEEEIDVQPAASTGGENYGWSNLEGTFAWRSPPPGAVSPIYEYDHRGGGCSITGGFVYRGSAVPNLRGWYVFGDFCLGTINGLHLEPGGRRVYLISGQGVQGVASFGQDQQGELYALSIQGEVYKLVP